MRNLRENVAYDYLRRNNLNGDNLREDLDQEYLERCLNLSKMKLRSTVADSHFFENSSSYHRIHNTTTNTMNNNVDSVGMMNYSKLKTCIQNSADNSSDSDSLQPEPHQHSHLPNTIYNTNTPYNVYNNEYNNGNVYGVCGIELLERLRLLMQSLEDENVVKGREIRKLTKLVGRLNSVINSLNEELLNSQKNLEDTTQLLELTQHKYHQITSQLTLNTSDTINCVETSNTINTSDTLNSVENVDTNTVKSVCAPGTVTGEIKFMYKLMRNMYVFDVSEILPSVYKGISEMKHVLNTPEFTSFIQHSILHDSKLLHQCLTHLQHQDCDTTVDAFVVGLPLTSAERQAIKLLESSPITNSMENNINTMDNVDNMENSMKRGKMMNRMMLLSVLRGSGIVTLYNYLFEAIRCDNFRVVEIIFQAVINNFLDLQLFPKLKSILKHPILHLFTSLHSNSNTTLQGNSVDNSVYNSVERLYGYLNMLNYNFGSFPEDPVTGNNLFHYLAGHPYPVVHLLKPYLHYVKYLTVKNKELKSPVELSNPAVRREFNTMIVMDLANQGSQLYKHKKYPEALKLYNKAIYTLINTVDTVESVDNVKGVDTVDPVKDVKNVSNVDNRNLGKLYYNRGRSLLHMNEWLLCVESCEMCLLYIPDYTNAYYTLMESYEQLLDWDNALAVCLAMRDTCGFLDHKRYDTIINQKEATYFQLLNIHTGASESDIKKAFNTLCKLWHPDKHTNNTNITKRVTNHFNRLYEAREKLMDPAIRLMHQLKRETNYQIPIPNPLTNNNIENTTENTDDCVENTTDNTVENSIENTVDCVDNSIENSVENEKEEREYEKCGMRFVESVGVLSEDSIFDFNALRWGHT